MMRIKEVLNTNGVNEWWLGSGWRVGFLHITIFNCGARFPERFSWFCDQELSNDICISGFDESEG